MDPSSLHITLENVRSHNTQADRRLFIPLKLELIGHLIRFFDGAREHYRITYTAGIEAERSLHPWRYRGHCWRQVALLNRAGERFDKTGLDGCVELSPGAGEGAAVDWSDWHECASQGALSSEEVEFKKISMLLTRSFDQLVVDDKIGQGRTYITC